MNFVLLITIELLKIAITFLLNIAEHENLSANKYENSNFFIFISRISCSAELSMKKFYNLWARSEQKSSGTSFNKSAVTDHMAKANHVINWEGAKVFDRENNQRLRQVKEAIRNWDLRAYSLTNIYRLLFTNW